MKKTVSVIVSILVMFFLAGCGQDLNVTVYNTSGVDSYADQYIGCTVSWDDGSETHFFSSSTVGFDGLDSSNSYSFKAKENANITAYAYGKYYVEDSSGNTTLSTLEIPTANATLYGGFPEAPDWYVAVYINEITIFNR